MRGNHGHSTGNGPRWFRTMISVSFLLTAALFTLPLFTMLLLRHSPHAVTYDHRTSDAVISADTSHGETSADTSHGGTSDDTSHGGTSDDTSQGGTSDDTSQGGTSDGAVSGNETSDGTTSGGTASDGATSVKTLSDTPETSVHNGERDAERVLRVLMHTTGDVVEMDLGVYLTGVVRGEMPAAFEMEALKAQAVAARTYTRYMLLSGGKHGAAADICTDSTCCQAYVSAEQARKNWGSMADVYEAKITQAVTDTDGTVILYDGSPILAVFHSSSAGLTRTAEAVWSGGQPYLQPVTSPEDESVPNYYSRAEFTPRQLREKLQTAFPQANLSGDASDWLTDVDRDDAGSILTMSVGGVRVQGSRVRTALGLRSACFTWEPEDGKMIFYVTGFGHGVGLSQYGANQMAKEGASWREILTHYYTGVTLDGYIP